MATFSVRIPDDKLAILDRESKSLNMSRNAYILSKLFQSFPAPQSLAYNNIDIEHLEKIVENIVMKSTSTILSNNVSIAKLLFQYILYIYHFTDENLYSGPISYDQKIKNIDEEYSKFRQRVSAEVNQTININFPDNKKE